MNVRPFAMVLLVLTTLLVPRPALAASENIRCAVKSIGYTVVVGVASPADDQALTQANAAACGFLISTGNWTGADKFEDWDAVLERQCVVPFGGGSSFIVWTASDPYSRIVAQGACDGARDGAAREGSAPVSTPAPSEPQTAHDAIAAINAGPHGTLPPPTLAARCSGSSARVDVRNQTGYTLTLYLDGPVARVQSIESGGSAALQIPAGEFSVGATVPAANVTPFSGNWSLGSCPYSSVFYIQ